PRSQPRAGTGSDETPRRAGPARAARPVRVPAAGLCAGPLRAAAGCPGRRPGSRISAAAQDPLFTISWYGRHGSLRRLGHGGSSVGTLAPGTTGRLRLEGLVGENATDSVAVLPSGSVCANDQIGWVPLGAAIVTLTRDPAR